MNQLLVPFLEKLPANNLSVCVEMMKELKTNSIEKVNWPENYPSRPNVFFKIAHNGDFLFIHFFVEETEILAKVANDFGPVWTDSCVEFFIAWDHFSYYNAEFSCIGKALLDYHPANGEGIPASPQIMQQILRLSSLGAQPFDKKSGNFQWNLLVAIPSAAYEKSGIHSFHKMKAKANFYKCGDNLTIPHFLSWSPIDTPEPSFHQPSFFGEIQFE